MNSNWTMLAVICVVVVGLAIGLGRSSITKAPPVEEGPPEAASSVASNESLPGGSVMHADESDFQRLVLDSETPVLVDFYADWCGPCQVLAPVLAEAAEETPGSLVVKVDVDQSESLARRYGISSIPSLLVFQNGEVIDRDMGVVSKSRIVSMLKQ